MKMTEQGEVGAGWGGGGEREDDRVRMTEQRDDDVAEDDDRELGRRRDRGKHKK